MAGTDVSAIFFVVSEKAVFLMKVMLFAAGLGTRLKPLTDTMPKALVPVSGKPLLDIVLRRLIAAGATEVVVNVHHFAEQIKDYLRTHDHGIPVLVSDETEALLDTGGGLRKAAPLFTQDGKPILIHNVDILSNADLSAFYREHIDCSAALLVSRRATSRYLLFNDKHELTGWTNLQTGKVRSPYTDLDPSAYQQYAFSGIHLLSPALFPLMESFPEKFSIIDFYLSVCDRVSIKGHVASDLHWLDVGKLDTLSEAEAFLAQ